MTTLTPAAVAAPVPAVQAARDLAAVLAETPEFQAFEHASQALRADPTAGQAIRALQAKQQALRAVLALGAASPEEQAELAELDRAVRAHPAISAYTRAQAELTALCQIIGDVLSDNTGLNFAAVCGAGGCC